MPSSKFGTPSIGGPSSGTSQLYFSPKKDLARGSSHHRNGSIVKKKNPSVRTNNGNASSSVQQQRRLSKPSSSVTFQQGRATTRSTNTSRLPAISNNAFQKKKKRLQKQQSSASPTKAKSNNSLGGKLPDSFKFGLGIAGTTAVTAESTSLSGPAAYAQLKKACAQNDKKALESLLASKMDVNLSNKMGSTVLMDTAWDGNLPMCSLLLRHKADVNKCNLRGNTALHFAHERSHKNLVRLLELAGADVSAKNNVGNTPEMVAQMKFVHKHGATELADAISRSDVASVKKLLSQGVNPSSRDIAGHTVLMRAVLAPKNSVAMIQALADAKADLNMQDSTSLNSALHVAYELNNLDSIEALLSAGAKTFIKNRSGFTAQEWGQHLRFQRMGDLPMKLLQMCEEGTGSQLSEFIAEQGQEAINGYDQTGRTPLIIAVSKSNGGMVHALLDVKADVNGKELKGARNGPLHAAYDRGDQEIVKVLLEAKADTSLRNRKGFTPEEVKIYAAAIKIQAAAKGRLERSALKNFLPQRGAMRRSAENIYSDQLEDAVLAEDVAEVVQLVNGGASLNARNSGGRTVLMMAVQHNNPTMVKFLLNEMKADPDVQDIRGNTALHIAAELDRDECITALEENGADVYVRNNIGFTGRGMRLQRQKQRGNAATTPRAASSSNAATSNASGGASSSEGTGSATSPKKQQQHLKPSARGHAIVDAEFAKQIASGDPVLAKEYIMKNAGTINLNSLYPRSGDTALIAAAKNDDTAMCIMLLELDADPNYQNNRGNSVLHVAHSRENEDLIKYLEDLDIMKCSLRNDNGYTAQSISQRLQRARKAKEEELRASQVYVYPQDLHDLIAETTSDAERVWAVKDWIINYEKVTAGTIKEGSLGRALNAQNAAGDTVLTSAVELHDLPVIQTLVAAGADVNIQNRRGNSAMHVAYESAQPHIIMFLLAQGGDLSLKNNVGYTPEQLLERVTKAKARQERQAAAAGKMEAESSRMQQFKKLSAICHKREIDDKEVSAWLENLNADLVAEGLDAVDVEDQVCAVVNIPNKMGETILFHLVRECGLDESSSAEEGSEDGFLAAFKLLLPYADLSVANLRGDTLLHAAYEVEDENLRTMLLEAGADPTAMNNNGFTPADAGRRVAKRREVQVAMQKANGSHHTQLFSKDLEKAVRSNDLDVVRTLLVQGANVNAQNANGSTVLMDAVWNGNFPMVELLCDSNADPNIANLRRNTALHFAYEKEHTEIAIYIEAHNDVRMSVNALGKVVGSSKKSGMTEQAVAMQRAMEAHSHARSGTKFSSMLLSLIEEEDVAGVETFLDTINAEAKAKWEKSPVDREDYITSILDAPAPKTKATVLMEAVQAGNTAITKLLLEQGADPNLQNRRGDTALHVATRATTSGSGDTAMLELLAKFQADSEIRNRMGMTPNDVRMRIQRKQKKLRETTSKFDDKMADMVNKNDTAGLKERLTALQKQIGNTWDVPPTLNAQNNVGLTLLMIATYDGLTDAMQLLIDAKTDLNVKDRRGETALHIAYEMQSNEAVELLNKAGADRTLTNRVGLTPPEVGRKAARQAAKKKAEQEAREKNANKGEFSMELSAACSDGEVESVVDLVKARADVNAQNKNGSTVLMDAAWNGHAQVVMVLVELKADPEIANLRQNTALHFAYMCEHVDVIEYLESVELAALTAEVATAADAGEGDAGGNDSKKAKKKKKKKRHQRTPSSSLKDTAASASQKKYISPVVKIQAQFRGKKSRRLVSARLAQAGKPDSSQGKSEAKETSASSANTIVADAQERSGGDGGDQSSEESKTSSNNDASE